METIVIDRELKALIPPLTAEELAGLEDDLVRDGCRDPLIIWSQEGGDVVLLDGHHRLEICRQHGPSYSTRTLELASREQAMAWICEHQLHRRNLDGTQRAMISAQLASMRQGARTDLAPIGAMSQKTAAQAMKVRQRTLQRAKAVLKHGRPELIEACRRGIIPVSVAELISKLSPEEQEHVGHQCLERGDAKPARVAAAEAKRCVRAGNPGATNAPRMDRLARYAVVLADPWRCGSRDGAHKLPGAKDDRAEVPLETLEAIGSQLAGHLAPDAMLFLWTTGPRLAQALDLLRTWGFAYCGHLVGVVAEGCGRSSTTFATSTSCFLSEPKGSRCCPAIARLRSWARTLTRSSRRCIRACPSLNYSCLLRGSVGPRGVTKPAKGEGRTGSLAGVGPLTVGDLICGGSRPRAKFSVKAVL
jgi:hypothetical protein